MLSTKAPGRPHRIDVCLWTQSVVAQLCEFSFTNDMPKDAEILGSDPSLTTGAESRSLI